MPALQAINKGTCLRISMEVVAIAEYNNSGALPLPSTTGNRQYVRSRVNCGGGSSKAKSMTAWMPKS